MDGIFLGLGSNSGNRQENLLECIYRLQNINGLKIIRFSSIYETEPVGYKRQKKFLNMAAEVAYFKTPFNLLNEIKFIENTMGRNTPFRWGPRNIDIDILYFSNQVVDKDLLNIPHPEIKNRMFVLLPLSEIAAEFRCPVSGLKMSEIRDECVDNSEVVYYDSIELEMLFEYSKISLV